MKVSNSIARKRKLFLQDTINHYNSTNRCEGASGCCYSPSNSEIPENTEGCAIGRHLTKKLAKMLDWKAKPMSKAFKLFPRKLQIMGEGFLQEVQCLHDEKEHWNKKGISMRGKVKEFLILKAYCKEGVEDN